MDQKTGSSPDSADLDTMLAEYAAAQSPEGKESLEGQIRRAHLRQVGETGMDDEGEE